MKKISKILKETGTLVTEKPKDYKRPYYHLAKLTPKHIRMIHERLQGIKLKEIAEHFHMKRQSVEFFFCSPLVKQKMNEIVSMEVDDSQEILQHGAAIALEHLVNRLTDTDENCSARIKDDIARDILNRAGFSGTKKIEIDDRNPRQATPVMLIDQEMLKVAPVQRRALVAALEVIENTSEESKEENDSNIEEVANE